MYYEIIWQNIPVGGNVSVQQFCEGFNKFAEAVNEAMVAGATEFGPTKFTEVHECGTTMSIIAMVEVWYPTYGESGAVEEELGEGVNSESD